MLNNMPSLAQLGQMKQMVDGFNARHPKLAAFFRLAAAQPMEAGTVIEVTLTRPGQEPLTANFRVQPEDVELLRQLQEMGR